VSTIGGQRADALPEHHTYQDRGCDVSPTCLACPLPQCRYDMRHGLSSMQSAERKRRVAKMLDDGANVGEIAAALGVATRTVYRYVQDARA